MGLQETKVSIASKLSRAGFSASFFLATMKAADSELRGRIIQVNPDSQTGIEKAVQDNNGSNYPEKDRGGYEPRRFKSLVAQLHREAEQRRPRADDQTPHEAPLVRVTRWLVIATIGLVVVGLLGFGAALLQWPVLRSTDEKTTAQVEVMRGQLEQMETEAAVRREQLEAKMKLEFPIQVFALDGKIAENNSKIAQ